MIQNEVKNVLANKYTNNEQLKLKMLEVLFLAEQHLKKHRLQDTLIVFSNHENAAGACSNNGEQISLQVNYVIDSDIDNIDNTILHEIAHALVGNDCGHNIVWQNRAKELGVTYFVNYRK